MFTEHCETSNAIPVMEGVILHLEKERKWKMSVALWGYLSYSTFICASHTLLQHSPSVKQIACMQISYTKFGEELKSSMEPFLCRFHSAAPFIPRPMERGGSERIGTWHTHTHTPTHTHTEIKHLLGADKQPSQGSPQDQKWSQTKALFQQSVYTK